MSTSGTESAAPAKAIVHGIIPLQLLHLIATVLSECSYGEPFETELEARQELMATLDEEYTVLQRGGTLILVKK